MKLKLRVDDSTTVSELRLLGALFTGLAEEYAPVFTAPIDEAEATLAADLEVANRTINPVVVTEPVDAHPSGPQFDKPKRTRRTKAEIAAAAAEVAQTPDPSPLHSETHVATAEAAELARLVEENSKVADAEAVAQASNEAALAEIAVATTPASESPSDTKTYTAAEVQKIAVATAGRHGPEKVKAIIAQYPGAARIADIPVGELSGFVSKLNAVS
jgi:hypothetical protein